MKILYDNLVNSATINILTENPEYAFTALKDSRLSRVARTVDDAGQYIDFTFSSAVKVDYFALTAHNISDTATVVLYGNSSDDFTTPDFTQALTVDTWIIGGFTEQEYQYWRVTIDDNNSDGYIQVGYVFLGTSLTMPGMNRSVIIPQKSNSVATKSMSGQLYGDRRLKYKAAEISCEAVTETERQKIRTFFDYVDVTIPFVLMIWEDDLDVEPPIYCSLTDELSWNKLDINGLLWSLSFKFEECF